MTSPAYISEPQIQFLSQLLDEIADGHLLVPRFQRPGTAWKDEQRLELMHSISQSTPIGSILVWRTRRKLASYDTLGPHALKHTLKKTEKGDFSTYLLDGHQRLSALFGALRAAEPAKEDNPNPEGICWAICYDFQNEDFVLKDNIEEKGEYIPLDILMDNVESLRFQRTLLGDSADPEPIIRAFEKLTASFQRYKIPVIPIVTDDLDEATRAFQRINSQGTPMSKVHMIHALTWNESFDLNARLEEIHNERLARLGWEEIDDQLILTSCQALLGLDIFESKVDVISQSIRNDPAVLDKAVAHLVSAIDFLRKECGIMTPRLLPNGPLLPLLAEGLRLSPPQDRPEATKVLCYWFWWTAYIGLAGGSNSSRMRRAIENIRAVTRDRVPHEEVMPPVTELASPPRRFDFRHARVKVLTLRMAEHRAAVEGSDRAQQELNQRGAEVIQPLVPRSRVREMVGTIDDRLDAALRGPTNRIIAAPEEAAEIRKSFLEGELDEKTRKAHLIPNTAINTAIASEDPMEFFDKRLRELESMERRFAIGMGILHDPSTLS